MTLNYPKFREWLTLKGYSAATVKTMVEQIVTFIAWTEAENIPEPAQVSYNDVMAYVQSARRGASARRPSRIMSPMCASSTAS